MIEKSYRFKCVEFNTDKKTTKLIYDVNVNNATIGELNEIKIEIEKAIKKAEMENKDEE